MTPDQLKSAIERRGFLVRLWLPEVDAVRMIVMMGDKSLPWEISTSVLGTIKTGIGNLIEHDFRELTNGQHFVWCKQCHAPLLRYTDQEIALKYLHHRVEPDIVLQVKGDVARVTSRLNAGMSAYAEDVEAVPSNVLNAAMATASSYRDARHGPDSIRLFWCPRPWCKNSLLGGTEEIIDEQPR